MLRVEGFRELGGGEKIPYLMRSISSFFLRRVLRNHTADMRNGLLTRLTYAVTNHEMRLRALEKPTATPTKVDGKCGPAAATCLAGTVK